MKTLVCMLIILSSSTLTATNSGMALPGPPSDAGNKDTSIMGGGTPGNTGKRSLDHEEIQEQQEERKKQKPQKQKDITDQNSTLDSI